MKAHAAVRAGRRDPRAAPLGVNRDVAASESCAFYGVADALTKCRVPRSCKDCLAKPGCVLNLWGQCTEETPELHTNDTLSVGLRALAADPTLRQPLLVPQSNPTRAERVFFAQNASYCGAADPICSVCRTQFQAVARSSVARAGLINQFCVGLGDCVCSGVCEVPGYRATWVQDPDCSRPSPVYVSEQRRSLPAISSTHRDPRAPLKSTAYTREVAETCSLYGVVDVQGCREPRDASACAQKEHCVFTGTYCKEAAAVPPLSASLVHAESALFRIHYQQTLNITACESSDPQCVRCVYDTEMLTVMANESACFGSDGCWCDGLLQVYLDKYVGTATDYNDRISNPKDECRLGDVQEVDAAMWIVAFVMFFLLLCGGLVALHYDDPNRRVRETARHLHHQATQVWRHMLDTVPGDLQLDLFGWRQHRRDLWYKEQQLLRGYENVSPVAVPVKVAFFPSAPEFDPEEESSAPTKQDPMALASAPVFAPHPATDIAPSVPVHLDCNRDNCEDLSELEIHKSPAIAQVSKHEEHRRKQRFRCIRVEAMAHLPGRSAGRRDPRAPLLATVHTRTVDETCAFYGERDVRGCGRPRQITTCLKRPHCVFTQAHCEDASATTNATTFTGSSVLFFNSSTAFYYQFASDSSRVCAPSDLSCASCMSDLNAELGNSSVHCVGMGGCLCGELVAFLERNTTATGSSKYQCGAGTYHGERMVFIEAFMFFVCVSVFLLMSCSSSQRKAGRIAAQVLQRQAARVFRHMLDLVPGDFQLDLFGWRRYQRHLRYKEQQLLSGMENLSPVTAPIEYAASPSAPDFDVEEEASAPPKQNPMALASAPTVTIRDNCAKWYEDQGDTAVSFAIPTAPDFDGV